MAATADLLLTDKASADKAIKKLSTLFKRAGQPVITGEFNEKPKRTAGVSYRELLLVVASGQQITLRVTASGDIFQVLLNGSVQPLKNQTDVAKAVGEIAQLAEKNQAAFQRKQARVKVAVPKGMTTPRPKMIDTLRQQSAELDKAISEREARVGELRQQLGVTGEGLALGGAEPAPLVLDEFLGRPLSGTPKQVAWAEEIRPKAARALAYALDWIRAYWDREHDDLPAVARRKAMAVFRDEVEGILSNQSAAFWIEQRGLAISGDAPPGSQLADQGAQAFHNDVRGRRRAEFQRIMEGGDSMLDSATASALAGLQAAGDGAIDVLRALGRSGGMLDDCRVPSRLGRDALVALGAVDRHTVLAENELTPAGERLLVAYESERPAPMLDSMTKLEQPLLDALVRLADVGVLAPDEFEDAPALKALMDKGLVTEHETGLCVVSEAGELALNAEGYSIYGEPLAA